MRATNRSGEVGLSLETVIFLIAVLGLVVYFFSSAGDSAEERGRAANQEAGGALVIYQSSRVYDALVRFLNEGGISGPLTLDTNPDAGIFSVYADMGRPPTAHPGFFERSGDASAKWTLSHKFVPKGESNDWYGLVLPGIKKGLCQKINAIVHKDAVNAEPVLSVSSMEQWIGERVVLDGADPRLARRDGCAAASDGGFVYYRVMVRR